MAKKKHQPPAKLKYDKSHPTISIRVSQDLKKQLDEIKEMSGKSIGDILREAVGVQSKSVKIARKIGDGLAKSKYGVRYKCSVCGGDMIIDTADEKKAAAKFMRESGWKHTSCG